jgi:predicted fused transcriptional regulator/phosphomethylpyrimidine kinase
MDNIAPFSIEELESIAKSLASEMVMKKLSHADLINNICEICLSLRRGGAICHAHKLKVPELEEERCTICMQLHMSISDLSDERRNILGELRCAVSMLENSQEFAEMVPEVFSNIIMGLNNAKGIADVAGIPGRLVKVRGRVKALMDPEFGVSSHLAKLLITIMEVNPDLKSAINIKYDDTVMDILKKLKMNYAILHRDPEYDGNEDELYRFAHKALNKDKQVTVIIDEGGFGIEPNTYLIEESASKLSDKVLRISRMVNKARNG